MAKLKSDVLRKLEEDYKKACNAWVLELARLWGIDTTHGYWVGDEVGGIFDFDSSVILGMKDIIYIVRKDITYEKADEWKDYICWAGQFNFYLPTLQEYVEQLVPIADDDARKRLSDMRDEFTRICEEERDRLKTKPNSN